MIILSQYRCLSDKYNNMGCITMIYNTKNVENIIKQALQNSYLIARQETKANWKTLKSQHKHVSVCRSLVYMHDVAAHPDAYFSRRATEQQWHNRAEEFAQKYGIERSDMKCVYMIVHGPDDIVVNCCENALPPDFYSLYSKLCEAIVNYNYNITSNLDKSFYTADRDADIIKELADIIEVKKYNWFQKLAAKLR